MWRLTTASAFLLASLLFATDPERDFSGKWVLDQGASNVAALGQVDASLTVAQGDAGILCSTETAKWSYALDGSETRKRLGQESRNSAVKWEGAALLVSTLVSGPQDYSQSDRWVLSRDRNTLTITRQIVRAGNEAEGTLVYRREGVPVAAPLAAPAVTTRLVPSQPVLARRPEPGLAPDVTVPLGTHVLLALVSEVSTKRAKDGDHVYLRTDSPIVANGRVVLPRGCDVEGTITHVKPAGHVAGKGELFIRFDSLILPNGVQRDFKARPSGGEGKVEGDTKSADGRTVLMGAGMGAGVGVWAGGAAGAGIGGAAGALAGVLASRSQDVVLRPGTHLEMVLDRDLVFHSDELPVR
jgi:type IV secretion system protein VirB10